MGLDITAYSRLAFIERLEPVGDRWAEEIWEDKYWGLTSKRYTLRGSIEFPGRHAPLEIPRRTLR